MHTHRQMHRHTQRDQEVSSDRPKAETRIYDIKELQVQPFQNKQEKEVTKIRCDAFFHQSL